MKLLFLVLPFFFFGEALSQSVSLRDTANQYDFVIITVPEFVSSCEDFKQHKETVRNLKTIIIDTTQIFAEFDSSMTPQENIRDFISYAGTFWKDPQPEYFLIAGGINKIPGFDYWDIWDSTNTVTDFYYRNSVYTPDTLHLNFYVGRIPAQNNAHLINYLNKIISYESSGVIEEWNNRMLIVAEDHEVIDYGLIAFDMAEHLPGYINPQFLFEKDSSIYSGNKDTLFNFTNNIGVSSILFLGSTTDTVFSQNYFLTVSDIDQINNSAYPFLTMFISKQPFSNTENLTMIDKMVLSDYVSIGGISPVAITFILQNIEFYNVFNDYLYATENFSIGEALNFTLNDIQSYSQKIKNNLWGDPSLKLKIDTTTANVNYSADVPQEYSLKQNYPNPFNPSTTIEFSIPVKGNVELKVFNILGKEVTTLTNRFYNAGNHKINFEAESLSSGIYFYSVRSGEFYQTKKMILIK